MWMASPLWLHSVLLLFVTTRAIGRLFTLATVLSSTVLDSTVSDWCPTWLTVMWDMSLLLLWGAFGWIGLNTAAVCWYCGYREAFCISHSAQLYCIGLYSVWLVSHMMDSHVRHVLAASLGLCLVDLGSILLLFATTLAIRRPFTPATVHSCTVLDSAVSDWCPTWWTGMWDMSLLLLWGCVWCS